MAFELAERVKAGADVEATTQFATRLFLGGLTRAGKAGLDIPGVVEMVQVHHALARRGDRDHIDKAPVPQDFFRQ